MEDSCQLLRALNNLDGARIEGRLENVQQRKKEIQKLHSVIQASAEGLVRALKSDLEWNEVDALLEISTVLQSLRAVFKSLDIKTALEEEHAVAAAKKDIAHRRPLGNILIVAEIYAPITQSIVPLCLAIAEGNTVVLILPHATSATSAKLLQILSSAVDQDAIVTLSPKTDKEARNLLTTISKHRFDAVVSQSSSTRAMVESLQFRVKSSDLRIIDLAPKQSIVVVTRNADVKLAALSIAQAKFSYFSGSLAVAPGLVLADEFVLEEFLEILQSSVRNIIQNQNPVLKHKPRALSKLTAEAIRSFSKATSRKEKTVQIGYDGSNETLIVGTSNSSSHGFPHLQDEDRLGYPDPVLSIVPTTSLEAALTITNMTITDSLHFSVYLFGNSSEARYLSLFSYGTATYVNNYPISTAISILPPTQVAALQSLFCNINVTYAPKTLTSTLEAKNLQEALTSSKDEIVGLSAIIMETLEPPKQKPGSQMGFFPQGGLVGLGHIFALLSLVGVVSVVGIRRSFA